MMAVAYLLDHPWLPAAIWGALFVWDVFLGISLSKQSLRQKVYEYEMAPMQEQAIRSGSYFSWSYVVWLAAMQTAFLLVGYCAGERSVFFAILVGVMIFSQLGRALTRLEGIANYRRISDSGITGSIKFPLGYTYLAASRKMAVLAVLMLAAYALSGSLIVLGGAIGLGLNWFRYLSAAIRFGKKHEDK